MTRVLRPLVLERTSGSTRKGALGLCFSGEGGVWILVLSSFAHTLGDFGYIFEGCDFNRGGLQPSLHAQLRALS